MAFSGHALNRSTQFQRAPLQSLSLIVADKQFFDFATSRAHPQPWSHSYLNWLFNLCKICVLAEDCTDEVINRLIIPELSRLNILLQVAGSFAPWTLLRNCSTAFLLIELSATSSAEPKALPAVGWTTFGTRRVTEV